MRMSLAVRYLVAFLCVAVWSLVAFAAASANLEKTPSGYDLGGEFEDDNGNLEEEHGEDSTWAQVRGIIEANDTGATASKSGGAFDKKDCVGVIANAETPLWLVDLSATMGIYSSGYHSANYDGELDATARGVLAIYGDFTGSPLYTAAEAKTSTSHAVGNYNIEVTINGDQHGVDDGGLCKRPSNPLADRNVSQSIEFDNQQFGKWGERLPFTYESKATGSMHIEMSETGPEKALIDVDQNEGAWTGLAVAWDMLIPVPELIQAFVLD